MDVRELYEKLKPFKNEWLDVKQIKKIIELDNFRQSNVSTKLHSLVKHGLVQRKESVFYNKAVYRVI